MESCRTQISRRAKKQRNTYSRWDSKHLYLIYGKLLEKQKKWKNILPVRADEIV